MNMDDLAKAHRNTDLMRVSAMSKIDPLMLAGCLLGQEELRAVANMLESSGPKTVSNTNMKQARFATLQPHTRSIGEGFLPKIPPHIANKAFRTTEPLHSTKLSTMVGRSKAPSDKTKHPDFMSRLASSQAETQGPFSSLQDVASNHQFAPKAPFLQRTNLRALRSSSVPPPERRVSQPALEENPFSSPARQGAVVALPPLRAMSDGSPAVQIGARSLVLGHRIQQQSSQVFMPVKGSSLPSSVACSLPLLVDPNGRHQHKQRCKTSLSYHCGNE